MNFEVKKAGRFATEHAVKLIRSRIGSRYNTWETKRTEMKAQANTAAMPQVPPPTTPRPFYQTEEPLTLDQFLPQNSAPQQAEHKTTHNLIDELERLQSMKDKGFLSAEEYEIAKQKLLKS